MAASWWRRLWGRGSPPPAAPPAPDAPTLAAAAREHFDRSDFPAAIEGYSRALELDPKLCEAYERRGVARERMGDLDGARADYAKSIEIHLMAGIRRQIKDPDEAGA